MFSVCWIHKMFGLLILSVDVKSLKFVWFYFHYFAFHFCSGPFHFLFGVFAYYFFFLSSRGSFATVSLKQYLFSAFLNNSCGQSIVMHSLQTILWYFVKIYFHVISVDENTLWTKDSLYNFFVVVQNCGTQTLEKK